MDVAEALLTRRSIRAFKPDPVPQEVLQEILEVARFAPSSGNMQPWELAIVQGEVLEKLKKAFLEKAKKREAWNLVFPFQHPFPEPFQSRSHTLNSLVYQAKGIPWGDREKRRQWFYHSLAFFQAPTAIYLLLDQELPVWSFFDCALLAMSLMVLAPKYGLGTCPQLDPILYPDVVRELLEFPQSKQVILAIATGYPDWDDPVNLFPREREPLENLVNWYGSDRR